MKNVLFIGTILVILFCSGCTKDQNETAQLQGQLSDMQQQIQDKNTQIENLIADKNSELLSCERRCDRQLEDLKKNTLIICPSGYTLSTRPWQPTSGYAYYCKLDKVWSDFIPCKNDSECGGTYSCLARGFKGTDFRCAPYDNELLGECYCDTKQCPCA